jgi:UDPglucose 6-dehydrogenase
MKITIAGYGVLGKAHEAILGHKHELSIADPNVNGKSVADFAGDAEGVICCVSTPERLDDGSCEMKYVYEVISETQVKTPVIIRSTISLEGWDMLRDTFPKHSLTFSPEFLRAATAEKDMWSENVIFMGGDAIEFWHDVYTKSILNLQVGRVDPKVLIAGKYFRNAFLATKVSFFNQIYDFCKAKKIDYNTVAQVVGIDPRIGGSHTAITDERGFGGHCFPKDASAIARSGDKDGVNLSIIKEAIAYNKKIRKTPN